MIVPTVHSRERLQLRVDPTLSDEEAWELLWGVARQMPDGTVFWCGELCGKDVGLPIEDGSIATVKLMGDCAEQVLQDLAVVVAA